MSRSDFGLVPARIRRVLGCLVLLGGAAIMAHAMIARVRGDAWQAIHRKTLDAAPASAARGTPDRLPPVGEAVARLRILRLGIDAVIVEGTDPRSLRRGPGHMRGSALPGERDNCIIAGHRDGPFGRLATAREGDVVEIQGSSGVSRYRVREIEVVWKNDTRPLQPSRRAQLTLVTCFPIHYLGPAPRRLVVRGELLGETQTL